MSELPVLHQFRASHFNEKIRWALDWKGIAHRRVSYLPGPHAPQIQRLSGQTATPVLVSANQTIAGSASIIASLDQRFPEKPLAPDDPEHRREALELERRFDDDFGPAVRTALFSTILNEPAFVAQLFGGHVGALKRAAYRAILPAAKRKIAEAYGTDRPEAVEHARQRTRVALDEVAKRIGPSGQLFGDRFSSADLTCSALLAPLTNPAHPDMAKPDPVPESVQRFMALWADHEAIRWVLEQYAKHRPASAEA